MIFKRLSQGTRNRHPYTFMHNCMATHYSLESRNQHQDHLVMNALLQTDSSICRATFEHGIMGCSANSPVLVNLRASPQHHPWLLQIAPTTSKSAQWVAQVLPWPATGPTKECRCGVLKAPPLLHSQLIHSFPFPILIDHVTLPLRR